MAAVPHLSITPEEYLALERQADHRSEYCAGEMVAMAGAREAHNLIAWNIAGELRTQFKDRDCRAYGSDMRVKVSETGLYTYPDLSALCGASRFEDEERDTLLNPTVIVEVLSPKTEAYDRGRKFLHYRRVESLQEYVLVAQDRPHVELFVRHGESGEWVFTEISGPEGVLRLGSVGAEIPLSEIYDKVDFAAAEG